MLSLHLEDTLSLRVSLCLSVSVSDSECMVSLLSCHFFFCLHRLPSSLPHKYAYGNFKYKEMLESQLSNFSQQILMGSSLGQEPTYGPSVMAREVHIKATTLTTIHSSRSSHGLQPTQPELGKKTL